MKHCAACEQEFEDHAEECPDCACRLRVGAVPASEVVDVAAESRVPWAPLLSFPTETAARAAIAKLGGSGIPGEVVYLGSPGVLGNAVEGPGTGVPVAVPADCRERALSVLSWKDPDDAKVLNDLADEELDSEGIPAPAQTHKASSPKYGSVWFTAGMSMILALAACAVAANALIQDVRCLLESSDEGVSGSPVDIAVCAALLLLLGLGGWLGQLYTNAHVFRGEIPTGARRIGFLFRPFYEIATLAEFFAARSGRAPVSGLPLFAPLGLVVFVFTNRLANLVGALHYESAAMLFVILAHLVLCVSACASVWLVFRLGVAHGEVADAYRDRTKAIEFGRSSSPPATPARGSGSNQTP